MAGEQGQHVFVSYVSEDGKEVDDLCSVLEASQIPYWRDRKSLAPGDAWKAKIREAIRNQSLVFLACFSKNSRARERSHMNEELTLAVEEFRKMAPGALGSSLSVSTTGLSLNGTSAADAHFPT